MTAVPVAHALPELLAPAGDWDALRAAVANGADAVYFGLDNFNARHRATNFTDDELPAVMDYLHAHNVKGFLAFNTLIFSDELPAAAEQIRRIAAARVDAVIVQDLGLARLIHALAPTLAIHASTQMTLTEPRGIEFVRRLGVSRAIVARELSLAEITKIRQATDMELEVFVHGALCVAYSGQCLTSEALGGRSANRGQCAQACRLPYDLIVDGKPRDLGDVAYLLSPQDLAAYDLVADLARLGIKSLKIEGRLKAAHYVAATTQTYRAALDAARPAANGQWQMGDGTFHIAEQQRLDLEQSFSRGFTHGFLDGVNHQRLVHGRFPKARGTRIGTVTRTTERSVVIECEVRSAKSAPGQRQVDARLDPPTAASALRTSHSALSPQSALPLKAGDGIVFDEGHPEQDEQGGRLFAVHARGPLALELEFARGDLNFAAIAPGSIVWKTDDPAIRRRLEHSFSRDTVVNRTPVAFHVTARVGAPLTVRATLGTLVATAAAPTLVEAARKHPATDEMIREQLDRLGDTPFALGTVTVDLADGPMVPRSLLNDLRRQVCAELVRLTEQSRAIAVAQPDALDLLRAEAAPSGADAPVGYRPQAESGSAQATTPDFAARKPTGASAPPAPHLYVLARTLDQLDEVLATREPLRPAMVYCDFEDVRRYNEAVTRARAAGMPIALATLRVVKPHEHGTLKQILDSQPDAVLVRNLAAVSYCAENAPSMPQIGDYSLNIANELTAALFAQTGLVRMVPSYDLNWQQMAAMLSRIDTNIFECVIHQHMPMFHMEHCVFAHTLSNGKDFHDCGRPCEAHRVDLRDRVGESHPLIPDVGCRNTVFNAQAQTAAEFVPQMKALGIRHFRIELLRDDAASTRRLLERYARVLLGLEDAQTTLTSLRVLSRLGVTRGTLDRE